MYLFTFLAYDWALNKTKIALHVKARTHLQALRGLEHLLHDLGAATARPGNNNEILLDSAHRGSRGEHFALHWQQESSERLPDSN